VHALRQVHRALKPRGLLLDVHPLGDEFPVLADERGLGFVDTRKFRDILEAMNVASMLRYSLLVRYEKRRTKASAVSATSRQPWSMVSACPRPGISTYSVTPSFRCCFL
jgi:hypothetical protein